MEPELESKTKDVSAQPARELGVPSVLYVAGAAGPSGHLLAWGPSVGWMTPQGIVRWEREVSVVARDAVTQALKEELGATSPEEQIAAAKLPLTARAAKASPLVGVARSLVDKLVAKGVRVHTVGFDKVSSGFYYFAEGGSAEPVRVDGSLFDMIAPALGGGSNAEVDRLLDGLIDRLVVQLSGSMLTEAALELAAALPKLSADNTGLLDCDLEAFEKHAAGLERRSDKHATLARSLVAALSAAGSNETLKVPLYGEARREVLPAIEVEAGGKTIALPAKNRWLVSGQIVEAAKPVAAAPVAAAKPAAAAPVAAAKPVAAAPVAAAKPVAAAPVAAKPVAAAPVAAAKPVAAAPVAAAKPVAAAPVAAAKPVAAVEKAVEAQPAVAKVEPKVEAKVEPKVEPKKVEAKPEVARDEAPDSDPKPELRPSDAAPKAPAKVGGKAAAKAAKAAAKAAKSAAKEEAAKVDEKPAQKTKPESVAPPSKRMQKREQAELAAAENKSTSASMGNAGLPAPVASAGIGRILIIAALVAIVAFLVYRFGRG